MKYCVLMCKIKACAVFLAPLDTGSRIAVILKCCTKLAGEDLMPVLVLLQLHVVAVSLLRGCTWAEVDINDNLKAGAAL